MVISMNVCDKGNLQFLYIVMRVHAMESGFIYCK